MDKVVNVSPKQRRVRCPECLKVLVEPASPLYECPFCSTLLRAKGVPPDFQGESWQMPMNENNQGTQKSQQTNELEAKSINDGSELSRSQKQEQLNGHEVNGHTSVDENVRQQEQLFSEVVSVVENRREQGQKLENHVGNGSTPAGDNDMLADCARKIGTTVHGGVDCGEEEGAPSSNSGESQDAQLLLDHADLQLQSQDAENCSMLCATEEKKELAGEDECDPAGEGNEQISQSEIIRENDDELSFKYISSALESYDPLAPRKRTPRLSKLSSGASVSISKINADISETHPYSSAENSDDYESYSSVSDLVSNDSLDSEFDFLSPSAESTQPPNLSDLFFQQKMLLSDVGHEKEEITLLNSNAVVTSSVEIDANNVSDVLNGMEEGGQGHCDSEVSPHQLEWQDVDHKNEEFASSNLNGAVTSSIEIYANTASDVLNGVEQGGEVERAEFEWHPQREDPIKKETFSVGHEDAVAIVKDSLHVQGGNAESIGDWANIVGCVDSKDGDMSELKENYNGNQGGLAYQLNNKDLQERVSGSLDLLSSGAGLPSKLKCVASLKEGITNALISGGTEAASCFLSDGGNSGNCLATQENINNVANAKLEDSIATVASKDANSTGRADQSKITPLMLCIEKIQEGLPGLSCSQQNMLLPDAHVRSRRASTNSGMSTERDVNSIHLSQYKEPDSAGVQAVPFVNEQGNLSSHSAVNNSESQLRHRRIYSSEATQGHAWERTVNIFDSRMHHKRNYSGETAAQSEYTAQVQKSIHNEGTRMPRSARIVEGSSKPYQKHAQAAFELAEGQGPWPHQANMHMMQHSMDYCSGATNCFSHGSFQPPGSYCYSNGSDSFARGVPNASLAFSYRAPYPWMSPMMPGMYCGCHPVAPVCRACACCQHSHVPQLFIPPCGHCFDQSLPLAYQQGHGGLCNYNQAHQIQASDQGGSAFHHSPASFSPQIGHSHDTAMARRKPHVSSARKSKHYPPFTQGSTAPYIICKGCDKILEVPTDIPLTNTLALRVRCSDCRKVAKFSVLVDNQGTSHAALKSTTTNGASKSSSHSIQYTEHSRQSPVSNVVQSMDASYHQGINSGSHPHKQGSFDSQQQISAVSKRRGSLSLDEVVQSTQCEADTPDQDEFFFRSLSRHSEFDSSRIFFNMFKASSSAVGASNFVGLVGSDDMPLQAPVDEKEEGLDFGAPRMSDGESPDLKSPESRNKSPENKQHFKLLDQKRPMNNSLEDGEGGWTVENAEKQAFDLKRKMIAEGKKPSTSLFVLLNQNSSKFEINMEERVSFDESRSVLCSTASSSPVHDNHTTERSSAGDSSTSKTCKLSSNRFLRKGPNYVSGMFRRSMRDFSRGTR